MDSTDIIIAHVTMTFVVSSY